MADLATLRAECNEREARFAEAFVRSGNRTEAAREAGYKGAASTLSSTGRRVLERPHVQAYAEALRRGALGDPKTRLEKVMERLMHIAMGGEIDQPVGRGGSLRKRPAPASAQIKAAEVVAKALGGLDPRVRVELEPQIDAYLEGLRRRISPEAYEEVLAALAALNARAEEP